MREGDALLRGGLREAEANRIVVLLASMGIESTIVPDAHGAIGVHVSHADIDSARHLLAEEPQPSESVARPEIDDDALPAPRAWFGRGSAAVFALMIVCVGMFVVSLQGEGTATRSRLLALGAIDHAHVEAGEHWRLLTAIFLHFDLGHLLSNLSVLLILGPPLAHQIGGWRFVFVFLAAGVGANVVSHLLAPVVGLKAGASGAIAGVLGALGGLALRPGRRARRRSWQTLGALAAIYGLLIGFGPGRDNVAHFAGVLAGILLGWALPSADSNRDRF